MDVKEGRLRQSRSLADLTHEQATQHTMLEARQRSGSSADLLRVPGSHPQRAGSPNIQRRALPPQPGLTEGMQRRSPSPNIAQLAAKISHAEVNKLRMLGGGVKSDSVLSSQGHTEGRAESRHTRHMTEDYLDGRSESAYSQRQRHMPQAHTDSQNDLHFIDTSPYPRRSRSPVNGGSSDHYTDGSVSPYSQRGHLPPSPLVRGDSGRNSAHSSASSGLEFTAHNHDHPILYDNRPRSGSVRSVDMASDGRGSSVSRSNSHRDLDRCRSDSQTLDVARREMIARPSLPDLETGRLNLRPHDQRRSSSHVHHLRAEFRTFQDNTSPAVSPPHPQNPVHASASVSSIPTAPPLPPARPRKMASKRLSVPDILDAKDNQHHLQQRVASHSDLYRRRMTDGEVMALPLHRDAVSDSASSHRSRKISPLSDISSVYNLSQSSGGGPSAPPPPSSSLSDRSSRPPSLRRKMFDNLTVTTKEGSPLRGEPPFDGNVPSINVTQDDPLKSPVSDYPDNDLSPDADPPYNHHQASSNHSNIYKATSDTSTAYIGQGTASEETRSTNTDSGLDSEEIRDETNTWRPYDVFQVSEREVEDDGAVFREILKVIRLVLYFVITTAVIGGTVASRLSLFVLSSGITQDAKSRGESVVMLLFCLCSPMVVSWIFAFMKILFSGKHWPSFKTLFVMMTLELLQTFGVCLLVFRVMPATDFFRGITVTMATFTFPALFKLILMERKPRMGVWDCLKILTTILAFLTQVAAIPFFLMTQFPANGVDSTMPKEEQQSESREQLSTLVWELPVAVVLVSLGWWENYVSGEWSMCGKVRLSFQRARKVVQDVRETVYFLVAPFKIGLTILLAKFLTGATFLLPEKEADDDTDPVVYHLTCYSLLYLQLGATALVTYLASLACKLHMQKTAFALPLVLSPPASLAVVYLQCRYEFLPLHWHIGWWYCPSLELSDLVLPLSCAGALWVSYCLIVSHVWFPRSERMAKVERLFITPHFDSLFPDFHLTLRRRRNDRELRTTRLERFTYVGDDYTLDDDDSKEEDDVPTPMVYVCATMWHETGREMTQLLKSLFRLDYVHCASKLAQDKFRIRDPDYFDLEVHIIFDDAFELDEDSDRYVPNMFVRQLIECMEDAARSVVKGPIIIPPPVKSATPYGGRLVWTMPGQTKMYVHLKNKNQIRHRKRWSQVMIPCLSGASRDVRFRQESCVKRLSRHPKMLSTLKDMMPTCMYLYYLLGYRLLGGKDDSQLDPLTEEEEQQQKETNVRNRGDKSKEKKKKSKRRKAATTIPLRSLMGHMSPEKHEKTIQMSENTFILTLDGDVDFKPDSVKLLLDRMKKNRKVGAVCGRIHPIGSGPMVWYQQFEYAVGHWLQKASEHVFGCVLCCPGCFSLFRGSALMDDNVMKRYTTKPTEAAHFIQFEQGEDRWLCTLLLQQGHRIDYSAGADALTFAPETFNEFFNQRRRWSPSTLANMMDLLSSWRETVRMNDNVSRLYILYQFLLMASSILAPSTVVLMITGSFHSVLGFGIWWSFILSLLPVVFYLIVCLTQKNDLQIQIGAVLTALYTVVMMIATVGTLVSIATESYGSPNVVFLSGLFIIFVVAAVLHPQEFFCLTYGALYFLVVPSTFILLTVYYLCNLNNVSWGTREVPKKLTPQELEMQQKEAEEKAKKKKKSVFSLYGIVSLVHELRDAIRGLWGLRHELHQQNSGATPQHSVDVEMGLTPPQAPQPPPPPPPQRTHPAGYETNPDNPHWLSLDYLGYGMTHQLTQEETEFWRFLIRKYLYPLDEDKNQKKKIAEDLKIIRNNVVFIYIMMNFLWCVIALQVQAMEDTLKTFYIVEKYEPLSLVFLSIFALVLLLQFLSMLVHRWGTFLHLMSSTRIDWCKKSHSEEEFARFVVSETQKLQNLEPLPDYEEEEDSDEDGMSLSDFDASLQNHEVGDTQQKPQDAIYETLTSYRTFGRGHYRPGFVPLQRMPSTRGEFPMLKTIFEQNLENLQHWWKHKGTIAARGGPNRTSFKWGTQRRYLGNRQGEMRQRFFNQNFQMPVHNGDRLFM